MDYIGLCRRMDGWINNVCSRYRMNAWMTLVMKVKKEHPTWMLKEVLKQAKVIYKKK